MLARLEARLAPGRVLGRSSSRVPRFLALAPLVLAILLTAAAHLSEALPTNVADEFLFKLSKQPLAMRWLPDGRVLVLERLGQLTLALPDGSQTTTYMELPNIAQGVEYGLFDLALSPEFEITGQFYVYYSPRIPARLRISAFTHDERSGGLSSRGLLSSEIVVWEEAETGYQGTCCHFGGALDFGPDGKLYVAIGDLFNASSAQDMSSSHGKVLRLNADGTIPEDNHGVVVDGRGGAVLDEIHASGMRNPFRGRWDMESGLYLIGVVGGNNQDTAMEDIKSIVSGANYGWPHCEGPCGNPDFPTCSCAKYEPPLLSYPHHGEGKSLTGGVVYRGGAFPADPYDGAYFFADYVEGWVRYAHLVLPTAPGERPTLSNVTDFAEDVGPIVVLAEAPDGALWYANLWGNVRRFVYTDGSAAPVVSQPYVTEDNVAAAAAAPMGATVNVTWAVVATDADGDALTFEWYPGDGTGPLTTATPVLTHTYSTSGRYHAYVRVSDGVRAVRSVGSVLDVGPAPLVTLSSPTDGATFVAGQTLALRGSATHNGAPLDPALLTWHVLFQHDAHTHPAVTAATGGAHDLPIGTSGHSYTGRTAYAIKVTATAPGGVQSTATVTVWPAKVNVTVHTSPPGLPVEVDGLPHVTPYTEDTLANFTHAVCVQSVQCLNGRTMAFVGWQDDSTATAARIVRVPLVPTWAFTALYADHGPCGAPVTDGLAFYLRPDGLRRAEYDGNTIASWTDAADLSAPLTLGGGMPPTPMPGADSGLVVTEDVAMFRDGYLARTGLGALATGSADHTLVALLRYDGLGWGGFSFGRIGCLEVLGLGVTSQGYFLAESYCTSDEVQSGVLGTGSGWVVQTLVLRDGTWEHFVNGSRLEGGAAQWKVPTEGGSVILGADHGGGSTDLTVAEVLVYQRALAPAERMAVETYLTQTYLGGWTVEISSPIAGAELSGSTLAVTFAVAKASTSTTTSEPALAVQVDDLLPRLLTSDEQAARQVVVSLAATQLHHHIRLYAVQMDQETMLPGTLAEVEFLTDGTDNVKSSTQEVATSLETQSTTAASPPTSIVVTNTSDGTIVLQPTTWAADGRRVLQWTYATHIAASSFEWLVVLVDGTISGYVTSPEELTFTLPPLAPDHTATVTLALYLAEREPTFATLEVAGDEPPSSSATSTAPVQSTEATDSTSAALPEATPVVVDGLPWLNSIVGYSVRFASVPASGLDQSLHFHAAFNEPAAQLFGPVEARAAQCASLCDRNYHCRGIFVWLGEDGRERCLGLADVGLDRAAVTSLASASLIKTTTADPTLCVGGSLTTSPSTQGPCECPANCFACVPGGECVTCMVHYALHLGQCLEACPPSASVARRVGDMYACAAEPTPA